MCAIGEDSHNMFAFLSRGKSRKLAISSRHKKTPLLPAKAQAFLAHRLTDMSAELASVGRQGAFPLPHGRGDEFHNASPTPDARHPKPRDMFIRDLHLDTIRVRTRDFR